MQFVCERERERERERDRYKPEKCWLSFKRRKRGSKLRDRPVGIKMNRKSASDFVQERERKKERESVERECRERV